ncbi:hypothetical protein Cylst_4556 [Cylindrospermum stagnale PCC 7417]|uniref:Uncharacterized protein n=1 Tax=Cylindrospermum stagnale PCC 7417 TaxID=56107 RepID=K9X3H6_9NOST|nr:hypothetical protein [Cylindrospermum stagnale]AFZ26634.1 hypothetical protein Cylst_4556 [Cylindrospermum stagnale PCC 7417]
MIKQGSNLKCVGIFLSNFSAYALGILSYFIPLYPYEWSDEPSLAEQVDSDSSLVILCLSGLGLFCAGLASIVSYRSISIKSRLQSLKGLVPSIGALVLCSYRFIQVLPFYTG